MKPTAMQQVQNRQAAISSMKRVLSIPSGTAERWRAGYEQFLLQRPAARYEARYIADYVAERRKLMDKFASTKYSRMTMSAPAFLSMVLKLTDPEYFMSASPRQFVSAQHLRKMKKAFPEFFLPEVI